MPFLAIGTLHPSVVSVRAVGGDFVPAQNGPVVRSCPDHRHRAFDAGFAGHDGARDAGLVPVAGASFLSALCHPRRHRRCRSKNIAVAISTSGRSSRYWHWRFCWPTCWRVGTSPLSAPSSRHAGPTRSCRKRAPSLFDFEHSAQSRASSPGQSFQLPCPMIGWINRQPSPPCPRHLPLKPWDDAMTFRSLCILLPALLLTASASPDWRQAFRHRTKFWPPRRQRTGSPWTRRTRSI